MSFYTIEIDDNAIAERINAILNTILNQELGHRYTGTDREISLAVKELIYSHKEEIVERVVDKATREIVKKGLPLLFNRMVLPEKGDQNNE